MPMVDTSDQCSLHYLESSYVDAWAAEPETVLLVHGMAESALAWTAWVPQLARRFRVVRVDLPGFGRSRLHSADFDVSVAGFATELARFLDVTGIGKAHLVGAKLGGSVVLDLASRFPDRARSVTAVTGPMWAEGEGRIVHQQDISGSVTEHGTEQWARDTMARRLGSGVSDAQREWWIGLMAATDGDLIARAARANATLDLRPRLHQITAPALMITSKGSPLSGGAAPGVWRDRIAHSHGFLVLPCDGYHVAAAMPDVCAAIVAAFLGGAAPDELALLAADAA
ncbi:MAG TPA: alpha/beta hydrolase [Actinophytocola sp.]|jgi:pimeloyl-ACP methyl ester carboxylesterase|nr:alpha/beta hydrolase [Actinophytocola sp.]